MDTITKKPTFKGQQGMTLIELTTVLLILIGLAGLLIPYVSGFMQTTHDSTGSANTAALNSAIMRFENENGSFPDRMESLVQSNNVVYDDLMNPAIFTTSAINGMSNMSLRSAGLSSILEMNLSSASDSATFDSTNGTEHTLPMGMTAPTFQFAKIAPLPSGTIEDHLAAAFEMDTSEFNATCNDYLVFGIGQQSELIGRTISDAPVHFAGNGDMAVNNKYNRFVAVFEVDKDNSTAGCSTDTDRARFVGAGMAMMDDHIHGLSHALNHTWENRAK